MSGRFAIRASGWSAVLLAFALLVAGLGADILFAGRQAQELRRLVARRIQAQETLAARGTKDRESRRVVEHFKLAATGGDPADPAFHIEDAISQAGLERLELKIAGTVASRYVTGTRFFVRLQGDYSGCLRFVRQIEMSQPLAEIQDLSIATNPETPKLEMRATVTLYQPRNRGER